MTKHIEAMKLLQRHFDIALETPDGIKKLRALILTLAMQGKLVPQDPKDQPASELLKEIEAEKKRLVKEGKVKQGTRSRDDAKEVKASEVPYELPKAWEWVRLAQIGEVNPRNTFEDDKDAGFVPMPLILAEYGAHHKFENRKWSEIKKGYTHFADNDVALAKITPCFENGKSCLFHGLPNGIGAGTTELHIFRNTFNGVFPPYLLAYLKNPKYIAEGISKMTGSAGQKRVPTEYFALNPFPLPPVAEQKRIVAKIDQLMDLCDKLEAERNERNQKRLTVHTSAMNRLLTAPDKTDFDKSWHFITKHFGELYSVPQNLAELKKAILQMAVMGKLVPQDPKDQPASELLKEIEAEKKRLIKEEGLRTEANVNILPNEEYFGRPNGWAYCRLGNIAKFIDYRGRTPEKVDTGIPLITAKNVRFGFINREPYEYVTNADYDEWMTRGFPKIGDLLFTTEAPLGNIAIIDIEEKFALAQRVICFQLHKPIMAQYIKWLVMSEAFQTQLLLNATGMTATGIKASKLKEIPIPIPPLAEQKRIVAKIDQLMALCDTLDKQISSATEKQSAILNAVLAKV